VLPKPDAWHAESSFDSQASALLQRQYARALQVSFCKVRLQKIAGLLVLCLVVCTAVVGVSTRVRNIDPINVAPGYT
jgi:hypothetical protein